MGISDVLKSFFRGKPLTREELFMKKRAIQQKRDEARLALEREKAKEHPDMLKLDRDKRILCVWDQQLDKINRKITELQ